MIYYTKEIALNYGSNQRLSLSFSWNQSFWDNRLSINSYLEGDYRTEKGSVESIVIDVSDFSSMFSFSSNVLQSKRYNWNLTSSFSYSTSMKLAQEDVANSYSLSIRTRRVFRNNIALELGISNLLYNNAQKRSKVTDDYEFYIASYSDRRYVSLGISVPFGNMKARGASSRSGSSARMRGRLSGE